LRSPGERFFDTGFVSEYCHLETLRSLRFGTVFSIILVNSAGALLRADPGVKDNPAAPAAGWLQEKLLSSLRSCDVAGVVDDDHAVALLPGTDYFGSLTAIRKLSKAFSEETEGGPSGPPPVLSQATFPRDGRSFEELLDKALKRAEEMKGSLRQTLGLDTKLFWEIIGELFGKGHTGSTNASFDVGGGFGLTELFIDQVNELIVKEIRRTPQRKGILYFSTKKISPDLPIVKVIKDAGNTATRIFLAGEYEKDILDFKNAAQVHMDDPRLNDTFFTFFLSEETGYALVLRENWGGTFSCYHTSDPYLVECLIVKFQREYSLQEQLG
jgi:hypothetical protein